MKLTTGSMKQLGHNVGNVLGYRVLQDEEVCDKLFLMQRRKNVRNILLTSIVLITIIVPMVLFGSEARLFSMRLVDQIGFLVMIVGIYGGFAYYSTRVIRQRWEGSYRPLYLTYFGSVGLGLTILACRAEHKIVSLCIYLAVVMVLGGVSCLTDRERLLFVAALTMSSLAILWYQHLMWQEICCMHSWSFLGVWLSKLRYNSYIRECRQRRELRSALMEAETDPMTKLMNRRGLERSLLNTVPHCVRNEIPVAVLMLDIDNFKRYNDTFGHGAGDECIKKVAGEIRRATRRKTDLSARVGGEEFLIFLTGIEENEARRWALNLQEQIEGLEIAHAEENFCEIVTISVGIACGKLRRSENSILELRQKADEELYYAKEDGRACVSLNETCYRTAKMEALFGKYWLMWRRQA